MRAIFNFLLALPAVLAAPVAHDKRQDDTIAGSWIVRFNDDAVLSDLISQVTEAVGVEPTYQYNFGNFKGISIDSVTDAVSALGSIAAIRSIEPNGMVYTNALVSQQDPPYGLARISHREKGANEYVYDDSAGEADIFQGIYTQHNDFEGRASFGKNFVEGEGETDGNGHGTHVAGTTGSATYGVAKKTKLIAVKVLSAEGSGSLATVIAGIDFAVNDAKSKGRIRRSVANLSLGGIPSPMTNQAVREAVQAGLFMAVAAGNSGLPTITASPASEPLACTVAASDMDDVRASFSNFGLLVDIIAPGVDVKSTWIDGPDDTNTISGTSMSTPHITGLGAYLIGLEGERAPQALCSRMQKLATKGQILGTGLLTKNLLAYNGNGA